jgi:2-polyprenyl-6-methoxyphenol hydroxylase-like FAD-dependent oxidoreductase
MYDVVIVGARCAGASLATLLARRGHRVALIDRAEFPSDTISSHFLWPQGAARLASWGLLDRLKSRGCDPIPTLTFDFGSVAFTGHVPSVLGVNEDFCPRRTVLDSILVEAAVEAGVELFEGTSVRSVRWSEGTACGVDIKPVTGSETHLDARLVVGADGLHSSIAAQVGAEKYATEPLLTFAYYSYWSGVPTPSPTHHMRAGRLILRWPTNDGLTCIYVGGRPSEFATFRGDIEGNFMTFLEAIPGLRDEVAAGHREERFRSASDIDNVYRRSHGDGWALAGDAGHHMDPTTGLGMSEAFASAATLAIAVDDALISGQPWTESLRDYEQRRDATTANAFRLTLSAAALRPLPGRLRRYYEAASQRPDEVTRIIGALGGMIPVNDVFAADRIAAVTGN